MPFTMLRAAQIRDANTINANSALTANNSTYAFGKTEEVLNVNNALTANNSTYAFGKSEGALNANSALGANNSTYAFGKSEGALNANSALGANNATYAFGKSEITLKNSSYAVKTNIYTAQTTDEVILANGTFTINLYQANTRPGHTLLIKNIGSGNVTVTGNGTELIDGNNTLVLTALQSSSMFNDGAEWWKATTAASGGSAASLFADGNSGTTKTIDWGDGASHYLTLTANCTLTLTGSSDGGRYLLVINNGVGNFLLIWPNSVSWGPGGAPLVAQQPGRADMYSFVYVSATSKYYATYAQDY